jgi:pyruvate/2-oxoglutarate dehydrogenase complex dihydrolipoamide acyltransferase (E2) component
MLPLTLTFDHRIADGADGARFATEIVQRLEAPERLLWEW